MPGGLGLCFGPAAEARHFSGRFGEVLSCCSATLFCLAPAASPAPNPDLVSSLGLRCS